VCTAAAAVTSADRSARRGASADDLSVLRHCSAALPRRGYGRVAAILPLVVPPLRMRTVWPRGYAAETHMMIAGLGDRRIGDLLARMRHDRCGGRPEFVELITGIPGASTPVRWVVRSNAPIADTLQASRGRCCSRRLRSGLPFAPSEGDRSHLGLAHRPAESTTNEPRRPLLSRDTLPISRRRR
jgi:hypothetical protein